MKKFILINVCPGNEEAVYKQLGKAAIEVHPIFGEYTAIAKIEIRDSNELKECVDKIKNSPGVNKVMALSGTAYQ